MTPTCGRRSRALFLTLLCTAIPAVGQAQARAPDIPRGPDGKPDLSGIWQVLNSAALDLPDHSAPLGLPPGQGVVEGGTIPYQPAGAAKQRDNFEHRETDDRRKSRVTCPATHAVPLRNHSVHRRWSSSYEFAHASQRSDHPILRLPDF